MFGHDLTSPETLPSGRRTLLLYSAAAIAAFLITVSHRPDAMLNPQFWAEDGKMWYQQAYNSGPIISLFTTEAGYFQSISRIVAAAAQLIPLAYAPFLFNFAAISVKVSVALFILSSRLDRAIPNVWARGFLAFVYLGLPHSFETTSNLTNAQWHLALLCFLVLIAAPSEKIAWRVFDIAAVAISAFSGPFCLLLVPVALIRAYQSHERRFFPLIAILLAASAVQFTSLVLFDRPSKQPLGADPGLFFRIVGGHLFFDAILGDKNYGRIIRLGWWNDISALFVCLVGSTISAYAFICAKSELRLLVLFSGLIIAGALISPAIGSEVPQWTAMWPEMVGSRYWLIPIFCFFACILTIAARSEHRWARSTAYVLLLLSMVGIIADWKHPRFVDMNFGGHAARFEAAPTGTEVTIPINPNWEMTLIKK